MIEERDLDQAIAECQSEREPNAWTCIRLASFLIIKAQLFVKPEQLPAPDAIPALLRGMSMAAAPQPAAPDVIHYSSGTEFAQAIDGKEAAQIWPVLDEMMSIVQTMHPKLYKAVMRRL